MQSLAHAGLCATLPIAQKQTKNPSNSQFPDVSSGKPEKLPESALPKPFLGTNAKSTAALVKVDSETGEVLSGESLYDPMFARFQRFALQSAARKLLPDSRTAKCLRFRQKSAEIQVWRSKEHGTSSFSGLQTCASVWACPVCSAKISERRRLEIHTAIEKHHQDGGHVLLLTLTNPHYLGDKLHSVLEGQKMALDYFTGDRASRKLFSSMGHIGSIRAMEVTHGRKRKINNGWHPHYHILMFCRSGLDLEALQLEIFNRWHSSCIKAGLKPPSLAHGVRLDDGSKAAAYASKWGLDCEMTKGHTKKSLDGETPFDLLRAYLDEMDKQGGALFAEFAKNFKGKRQLFWSRGLKDYFNIGELTDDELAYQKDDHALLLGTISLDQWRQILKREARAIILQLASHSWDSVQFYIENILRSNNEKMA